MISLNFSSPDLVYIYCNHQASGISLISHPCSPLFDAHINPSMEPSRKKLSAAITLLLILVMAAEMGQVQAGTCWMKSGSFHGWCIFSKDCDNACKAESPSNTGGECRGIFFECYCSSPCEAAAAAADRRNHTGGSLGP
ncbi:hypothetical protein ACP4OV_002862 [Aristida adscensionis]